jgi:MFS family permease
MRERHPVAAVGSGAADAPRRAPWLVIGLTGVILFAAFIGENATEAWSALHIERTLGAAVGHGSFGPAMLGLMMGLGRLSGQLVAQRLGEAGLIFWSAVLGMVGALVIAVAGTPFVALFGVAVTGLGMAVIVPSVNSILGQHVTEQQRSFALSRAWMLGMLGFFFGPAMMGLVAQVSSLRISFVAVALIVAIILPSIWLLDRRPKVATAKP